MSKVLCGGEFTGVRTSEFFKATRGGFVDEGCSSGENEEGDELVQGKEHRVGATGDCVRH